MAAAAYITLIAILVSVTQTRLVFPPGSDVGYIVSDDPETKFDETNGITELDNVDQYAGHLLHREKREAADVIESALLRAIEDSARLSRREDTEVDDIFTTTEDPVGQWLGKWFPHPPQVEGQNRMAPPPADLPESLKDKDHGVKMGISHVKCDNGKKNLTIDWDESPVNFTCFDHKRHRLPVKEDLESASQCVHIPKNYVPKHYCMNTEITYDSTLPKYGPHRPLWPTYGEYIFIPPQRWLHAIEHGAIVMLYHPCAEPSIVKELKKVVVDCFRKHVITPYSHLTEDRPLALVAWGCSLEMATVNTTEAKDFIKKRALHGPEGHMSKDGSFNQYIITKSKYPPGSDGSDRNICPMDQA